jgi:hypothetical protein
MNNYHKEIESYFLQSFLSKKVKVNIENPEKQNYFFNLSKDFQLSGYLLNSIDFSENTTLLKEKLVKLHSNYLKKILLMRYEILKISSLFERNNIEYVVLKGMAMEIKEIDSSREFRDIDILINQKDLKRAYALLRSSGYVYYNKQSNDCAKYLRDMHHLPPMVNNMGIIVELHHRITLPTIFKSCPLTNIAFLDKEIRDGINVPSDKILLVHTLYHGILHHELNSGPNFLLDIKNILMQNKYAEDSINNLLEKLNLTSEYRKVKSIIRRCKHSEDINNELMKEFYSLFKGKQIFTIKALNQNNKISLLRLNKFIRFNSYNYQLPYWSPKLIFYLIKKLFKKINN